MKIKLLAVAMAGLFGGVLQASSVISCAWNTTSLNSCLSGGLTNFTTQLDWAAFGTPTATLHNSLWTASTGGYNITVSTENAAPNEGAGTAYNFGSVKIGSSWWDVQSVGASLPNNFAGNFNSVTDNPAPSPVASPTPYGDHLMGFVGETANTNKSLVIDLGTTAFTMLGFRLSAITNVSFDATIQFFSGANGTGSLIGPSVTLSNLMGGGPCAGLVTVYGAAPVPCNTAPFLIASGYTGARSFTINTNDAAGFYLGDLYVANNNAPEPSTVIFGACGLVLLFIGKKRWGGV